MTEETPEEAPETPGARYLEDVMSSVLGDMAEVAIRGADGERRIEMYFDMQGLPGTDVKEWISAAVVAFYTDLSEITERSLSTHEYGVALRVACLSAVTNAFLVGHAAGRKPYKEEDYA